MKQKMLDLSGDQIQSVQVQTRNSFGDTTTLWVNIDGVCVLRVVRIPSGKLNFDLVPQEKEKPLNYEQAHKACQEMEISGGHFANSLAKAFFYADSTNEMIIREAFDGMLKHFYEYHLERVETK